MKRKNSGRFRSQESAKNGKDKEKNEVKWKPNTEEPSTSHGTTGDRYSRVNWRQELETMVAASAGTFTNFNGNGPTVLSTNSITNTGLPSTFAESCGLPNGWTTSALGLHPGTIPTPDLNRGTIPAPGPNQGTIPAHDPNRWAPAAGHVANGMKDSYSKSSEPTLKENEPLQDRPPQELSRSRAAANYPSNSCQSTVHSNVYRLNRPIKPTNGTIYEDVPWICSLCQEGAGEELGPLYGPFYHDTHRSEYRWPPYIDRAHGSTSFRMIDRFLHIEIWFHAGCVLWTPGILLRDGEVVGLGKHLPKYWKKECTFCKKLGAAIQCVMQPCNVQCHYPCAIRSGLAMNENSWTINCSDHPAKKRKKSRWDTI